MKFGVYSLRHHTHQHRKKYTLIQTILVVSQIRLVVLMFYSVCWPSSVMSQLVKRIWYKMFKMLEMYKIPNKYKHPARFKWKPQSVNLTKHIWELSVWVWPNILMSTLDWQLFVWNSQPAEVVSEVKQTNADLSWSGEGATVYSHARSGTYFTNIPQH